MITIKEIVEKIKQYKKSQFWCDYYNDKYPKTVILYPRHETDGDYNIDIRYFINENISGMPIISGITDDEKAFNSLIWIQNNIKYLADKTDYGFEEYWAYSYQTLKRLQGDCEDGAILLYNIMLANKIPYWKMRITAGNVDDGKGNSGGHCFVTYFYEDIDDSKCKWVLLDWCYWPNKLPIINRKEYKDETYYKETWFSWNKLYSFAKDIKDTSKIEEV